MSELMTVKQFAAAAGVSSQRIYQRLDEIERVLLPYGFIRCHRSCLVNMRYVTEVSNYLMTISTGEVFTIPRSRYQMVKKLFREYTK